MKRLLVLVLLVPILALTMISCDADMRSSIAGFMGGFGGNVYADAGLIIANTAQAEAAAATIAAIGTGGGVNTVVQDPIDPTKGKTSSMGVEVTVDDGTTLLSPQSKDKQTELKNNLGDAFNSDTQKKKLLEDLKKPVAAGSDQQKAAQGTVTVLNASLDKIKTDLGINSELGKTLEKLKLPVIADGDALTQGDLLALQLMTDLISNTVATLNSFTGGLGGADDDALADPDNKAKVLSIIDDALFVAEMAENLSGTSSIDFTGQIDLGSLLDGLGNKGARSRGEPLVLTDVEDFIGTINALAPSIVELMGVIYDGTNFVYTEPKYKSFILNQQIYRSSMEQALKMMDLGGKPNEPLGKKDIDSLKFDTSTLVKYTLAVLITEHHAFWENEKISDTSITLPSVILAAYLNDPAGNNKDLGLGTLKEGETLTQPTGFTDSTGFTHFTGFDYDNWPAFLKTGTVEKPRNLAYFKSIINNLIAINKAGGIAQLTEELEKFRDAANTEDGLAKWYDEL